MKENINLYINIICALTLVGALFNKNSVLFLFICFEILLVIIGLKYIIISNIFIDGVGFILFIIILVMAAVETGIGLSLVVFYFYLNVLIDIRNINFLGK